MIYSVRDCYAEIEKRLRGPAPGRIQLLDGPRQVGKTTLLLRLAERLGPSALYAAADGPEASLPGFWERLWTEAERLATERSVAVLLIDEIHLLPDWSARLKGEWDRIRRRKLPVHVVATGSSSLRLGTGSRESLAGRFERLTISHWSASSLSAEFAIDPVEAAQLIVQRGAYPGAMEFVNDPPRWISYLRDAIVEPAIGRDILAVQAVRKPALLRQVFGACVASPAQIVSLQKLRGQLQDTGALETIAHYLQLLESAFLVAALPKFATRPLRQRSSPPKLVPLSNALLAATDPRGIPDPQTDAARFGGWVENACLAYAWNAGQEVSYWREEPFEVDAIVTGSWGHWAIEIKTGTITASDLQGLAEFTKRNPQYTPLVACDPQSVFQVERLGFKAMSWSDFLFKGPS